MKASPTLSWRGLCWFQEHSICGLCAEPAKSTANWLCQLCWCLWLCSSLMICSLSHQASFWILAPSQLHYWSEKFIVSKILLFCFGIIFIIWLQTGSTERWGNLTEMRTFSSLVALLRVRPVLWCYKRTLFKAVKRIHISIVLMATIACQAPICQSRRYSAVERVSALRLLFLEWSNARQQTQDYKCGFIYLWRSLSLYTRISRLRTKSWCI